VSEPEPIAAEDVPVEDGRPPASEHGAGMLPERRTRPPIESAFVRVVATGGVVGIGVVLGAILSGQNVEGWIVGLVVALVSVILSAILWSSRRL
jgi:protein-S-isoprenylcysteine O-methyltransferase Ste14